MTAEAAPTSLLVSGSRYDLLPAVAWLIGVPWRDALLVGSFIGEKVVINEFVAYVDLSSHLEQLQRHS